MRIEEKKLTEEILRRNIQDLYNRADKKMPQMFFQKTDIKTEALVDLAEETVEYLEQSVFDTREKAQCLESVFNHLNGHRDGMSWPKTQKNLSDGLVYPIKGRDTWDTIDYQQKISAWEKDKKAIIQAQNMQALLDELEEDFFYLPSAHGNKEVSLYDHIKWTMAVGYCIERYFKEKNIDFEQIKTRKVFRLFSMDVSGIQDFIYTISTKGALKSLRARSFYLELMMEHMVDEILESIDLTRANLIYSGGGHSYILLPNTEAVNAVVEKQLEELNQWLLQYFQAELFIGTGSMECSLEELCDQPKGSYSAIFQGVSRQISEKKVHRYSADQIRFLNRFDQESGTRECNICKRMERIDDEGHCELCASLLRFSNNILKQDYYAVVKEKQPFSLPLPGNCYLVAWKQGVFGQVKRLYCKNIVDKKWHLAKRIWIGDYAAKDTLEEMAEISEGITRLGVYRADVDNLGNAFVAGFHNSTLLRTSVLSKHLSLFFKFYINQIISGKNAAIVYAGGDDLFIVGAWNDIIQLSVDLQEELKRYTQGTLTISGGIGLYSDGYPISAMAAEVADLEECSKQQPQKNAITLFSEEYCFDWQELKEKVIGEKQETLETYFNLTEKRGNTFLYHLLELIRNEKQQVNLVRYVYLLSRMEPERADKRERDAYQVFSKQMYQWIQSPSDRRQLIMAIYLYVYNERNKGEKL